MTPKQKLTEKVGKIIKGDIEPYRTRETLKEVLKLIEETLP